MDEGWTRVGVDGLDGWVGWLGGGMDGCRREWVRWMGGGRIDDAKMGGWIQGWILTLWKHQIIQLPIRSLQGHASARSNFTESIMFSQRVSEAKHSRLIYLRKASRGRFFHSVSTKHLIQNRKGKCDFS